MVRFEADMKHRTFREQVELERAEFAALGLFGLPTTVIGNQPIIAAQPIQVFRDRNDAVLAAEASP